MLDRKRIKMGLQEHGCDWLRFRCKSDDHPYEVDLCH